ncbi:MAG: hypothetical protein ACPGO3_08705 [Magnetospiraceae bacterium]
MVDVLSASGFGNFDYASLAAKLIEVSQARHQTNVERISTPYDNKIGRLERERDKWLGLSDDLSDVKSTLHDTIGRVKAILDRIDQLQLTVNKAAANESELTGYASTFDSLLKGLRRTAENAFGETNLLGSEETTFSYEVDFNYTTQSVKGYNLGTGFEITDSDGKVWVPNFDTGIITRYDDYPDEGAGTSAQIGTGFTVDSIDGTDITFTIGAETASPTTYTGTLEPTGLGILGSWAYGDLNSEEGRTDALDALEDAKAVVKLELTRYEVALSLVDFYEVRAFDRSRENRAEINDLIIDKARAVQEAQQLFEAQTQLTINRVSNGYAQKNYYAKFFAPFLNSNSEPTTVFDILI